MSEWNDLSVKRPAEGEVVDIRLPGGSCIKSVEFSDGRFWKVRKLIGGQAYTVEAWRAIESRKESREKRSADGTDQSSNG